MDVSLLPKMLAFCRSRFRSLLSILLLWSTSFACLAQTGVDGFTHHVWGFEDGLPAQDVDAIAQTADGYLWLGTPHGLIRFDGYTFADYGAEIAPVLHEYGVSTLFAASDGTLWIGSLGGGITHLAGTQARTYGLQDGLQNLAVRVLHQDKDGMIWAGTDHGFYRLEKNRFLRIPRLGDPSIAAIAPDKTGGLWFAGHRLLHLSGGAFEEAELPAQSNPRRITAISVDEENVLWIGTPYGLLRRAADGVISPVREVAGNIRSLYIDRRKRLWIGTVGDGLILRDTNGRFVDAYGTDPLSSKVVRTCTSDASGDLWVGTQSGLARFSETGMNLWRVAHSRETDYGTLLADRDGSVWLSTGAITRLYEGKEQEVHLAALKNLQIRATYRERSGALWVGTFGRGAFRIDQNGQVHQYAAELGTGFIAGFLETPDGSVWIATDSGVARWSQGIVTTYQSVKGAPHDAVLSMALAPEDGLWVGTSRGLYLWQNGVFPANSISASLGRHRVWALYRGGDDVLWIGTESALYLASAGRLARLNLPQTTPSASAVLAILQDARSRILIGLPTVILRFDGSDMKTKLAMSTAQNALDLTSQPEMFSVAKETGAELYSGSPNTAQPDAIGGAWFATHLGVLHVASAPLSREDSPPPVVIERIAVDGVVLSNRSSITLQPSTRNLDIRATPILLSSRTGLRLRRRLVGLDNRWSDLSPGASSIYGKLSPGTYLFQVEARWPNDSSASVAQIEIIQKASFYRRPWFLVLCAAILGLLVLLYHQFELYQMKLRFNAVMAERNRVAREIHDTVLQGCIGVSSLLEAVASSREQEDPQIDQEKQERWSPIFDYARTQIKETVREARDAIWDLHNTDEDKPLEQALRELSLRLQDRTSNSISFLRSGEMVSLRSKAQHELLMVVREAILNAMAHAFASLISVQLETGDRDITIYITDNGKGFNLLNVDSVQTGHFGLASMHERMQKIGGSVTIDSAVDMGTRVIVHLPLYAKIRTWMEEGSSHEPE